MKHTKRQDWIEAGDELFKELEEMELRVRATLPEPHESRDDLEERLADLEYHIDELEGERDEIEQQLSEFSGELVRAAEILIAHGRDRDGAIARKLRGSAA